MGEWLMTSLPNKTTEAPRSNQLSILVTFSALTFATIWGVLARLGLEWIGTFAHTIVLPSIWPQIVGCFIMGFVASRTSQLEGIHPSLGVMVGTGFCGSLTTFSTWMYDMFDAFAQVTSLARSSAFSNALSGVSVGLVTLGMSCSAWVFGQTISSSLPTRPLISLHSTRIDAGVIGIGVLFYIGSIIFFVLGPVVYRPTTFAVVLGPPGTLLRYQLSQTLNKLKPTFPIGTFSANITAVLVFSVASLFEWKSETGLACAALRGIHDGFCGSLSTVSTFVTELQRMSLQHALTYVLVSCIVSQCLLVCIFGSWLWTSDRAQCVFE